MKIIEKIAICLVIFSLILKLLNITGGAILLAIFGGIAQVFYLAGGWYIGSSKHPETGEKINNIFFSIWVGMIISALVYGINSFVLHWVQTSFILYTMLGLLLFTTLPFAIYWGFVKQDEKTQGYYQTMTLRLAIWFVLGAVALFV
jgi:hypothetical protein